jgi:CubicO group peptidase (beta-lactamase class C family)
MNRLLIALWLTIAGHATAQQDIPKEIDGLFAQWNKPDTPGAAVAVIRDGEVVFARGYGVANLEYGIPISNDTVFHVASVSKQFTAMALVLLELDGKLSLEDDIRKYLPELPDYLGRITIRNLLQHTSGIRDQWQTLTLAGWRMDDVITQKQILRMLFRQKELNFPPGTDHLYSNGGYTLAAEIARRASGKASLQDFCDERIFKPLGMVNTHFHEDHRRVVRNRAYCYSKTPAGFDASPLNYANVGATSLFTTAVDLTRWLDNFRHAKVGGRPGVARLQERAVVSSGQQIPYALGVSIGTLRGLKTVSHSGGDAAYVSHVVWLPGERLGVAVLANTGSVNPGLLANRVAALFAGSKMSPEAPPPQPDTRPSVSVPVATLQRYAGYYQLSTGLAVDVEQRGSSLWASPPGQSKQELKALSDRRFYVLPPINGELEFVQEAGGTLKVNLSQGGRDFSGTRITAEKFVTADLPGYAGTYWSDELETQYTLTLKDGRLVAEHPHHLEIALTPFAKDWFRGDSWFFQDIRFTRDRAGNVDGVRVGGGRVRGIRFVRR